MDITFCEWCGKYVKIKDKNTGRDIPFILNAPQRRIAALLESDRLAGRPMRIIILKARQWGASTLIMAYMAWMQLVVRRNWHSIICAQVRDTSSAIRGMYSKLLENYPPEMWTGDKKPVFRNFEGSRNTRFITGRGSRVTVSSIVNQDAVRGNDFAMAHLSEVAFWKNTPRQSPEDVVRAVCGSVANAPDTLIVMESTANGTGTFFHSEWLRCKSGKGDKIPVFVAWHEIESYTMPLEESPEEFEASLDPYERMLRDSIGCSLEQIFWYRTRQLQLGSHRLMMTEYPSTDEEAFANSGFPVFDVDAVERLRRGCLPPVGSLDREQSAAGSAVQEEQTRVPSPRRRNRSYMIRPTLSHLARPDVSLTPSDILPGIDVWSFPVQGAAYIVAVDIGGRTERADFSVIAVLRTDSELPEVVAQWRGHAEYDALADTAVEMARRYNGALLVLESNTIEHEGHAMFMLERLRARYNNLYFREGSRLGFHTNASTKQLIITNLMVAVRQGLYIERDNAACDELLAYEQHPNGSYGAKTGSHDDILITRAIALYVNSRRS